MILYTSPSTLCPVVGFCVHGDSNSGCTKDFLTIDINISFVRKIARCSERILSELHWSSWKVDCVWNVLANAQKPDFVFRRNGRVHLNRRGVSVQSTTGSRGVRISGSNAGYTSFRGSVKSTGYPLHSPIFPSFPLSCVTVCHHISTGLYSGFNY